MATKTKTKSKTTKAKTTKTATKPAKRTITPLDDRILITPTKAEEKTASGIYLPEAAKEKPMTAKVVAVGPGKMTDNGKRAKISVKKGDVVVYGKYSGNDELRLMASHLSSFARMNCWAF